MHLFLAQLFILFFTFIMATNNWYNLPLLQLRALLDELLKYLKTEQNMSAQKIKQQLQLSSLSKLRYEREFGGFYLPLLLLQQQKPPNNASPLGGFARF